MSVVLWYILFEGKLKTSEDCFYNRIRLNPAIDMPLFCVPVIDMRGLWCVMAPARAESEGSHLSGSGVRVSGWHHLLPASRRLLGLLSVSEGDYTSAQTLHQEPCNMVWLSMFDELTIQGNTLRFKTCIIWYLVEYIKWGCSIILI